MGTLYNVDANTGDTKIAGQILAKNIPFPAIPEVTTEGGQTVFIAYYGYSISPYEEYTKVHMPKCRVKRLNINIVSNNLSSASTLTLRKNGTDVASLTIGARQTGQLYVNCDVPFSQNFDPNNPNTVDYLSIKLVLGGSDTQYIDIEGGVIWLEI
jgi:hypothetical protein